jgi:hypothetical protein
MKSAKSLVLLVAAALCMNASFAQMEKTVEVGGAPCNGVIHVIDHVVLPRS